MGTTKKPYVRKTVKQSTKEKAESTIKSIKEATLDSYRCTCCGKEYSKQLGNFPISKSVLYEGNNGYLPICRSCVDNYYKQLLKYYGDNYNKALEHCCWTFDWYYDAAAAEMTRNDTKAVSRVLTYPSKMNVVQGRGTTYIDTIKHRNGVRVDSMDDLKSIESEDAEEPVIPKNAVHMFGMGYSADEYQYLMDEYQSWTTRHECKTKSQEELFKNICRAQVAVLRAQKNGTVKEISDATKMLQDLMQSAGVKPTQNNDNALIEANTFGTLVKKWEKERPIAEPEEEWKDVDKINEYIDTFFFGHLCKALHVPNDKAEAYDKAMARYTVKPPVYDDDEEIGETSLLDRYTDKGEVNDGNTEE